MEQNKAEDYVVYLNKYAVLKMAIYGAVLFLLIGLSFTLDPELQPDAWLAMFFLITAGAFSGGGMVLVIFLKGLRVPGYQAALAKYTTDKAAKQGMIKNYNLIKATKPFKLTLSTLAICIGVGTALAFAVVMSF